MAKIYSAGDGHYLHLQTQFGKDRCMQFQVIVVTDPHTNTRPPPIANTQTGPITIHCAAKLSVQCNKIKTIVITCNAFYINVLISAPHYVYRAKPTLSWLLSSLYGIMSGR